MMDMTSIKKWKYLAKYDINQAASDFIDQPAEETVQMAEELGLDYITSFVAQLETDTAAELLRKLPGNLTEKVMSALAPDKRAFLKELLAYEPDTAGALMAKEILFVPIEFTIKQTIDYLQSMPKDRKGKVSYIYVVDQNNRLEGVIQIRDLVFYPPEKRINEILKSPVVQVETGMSQMDVARLLTKHRYLGLPVVDADQRLVGIISADNVMQVLEEEAVDDIAKIIGTGAEEIRTHSTRRIIRLRLPWLFLSTLSGLICAYISGLFHDNLEIAITLFLFIPAVLALSESAGVQGATIVVRNLALGEMSLKDLSSLFVREAFAGIFIGILCSTIVGLVVYLWKANQLIGLAVASSMTLTIIISAIIGLLLPLLFKRIKIDPAIASGPLVLAICDIQTLIVYFNLSRFILEG